MLLALCAAVGVLGVLQVAGLALVVNGLHRPITFLGVVVGVEALGSIVGGLLAPVLLRRVGELRLAAAGLGAMALGTGALAIPELAPVMAGAAVGGAGFSGFIIGYTTLLQRSTSSELQGRVFTSAEAAAGVPYCGMLGLTVIGIALVDYRLLMLASMLVLALAGLYLGGGRSAAPSRLAPALALARRASAR